MKQLVLTISLLCLAISSYSQQNLVLNPSFEKNFQNKKGITDIKKGSKTIVSWTSPTSRHPVLFTLPRKTVAVASEGRSAVGMLLGSSKQEKTKLEYITGELAQPLEKDQVYCVCFDMILQRSSKWAATDVGVLFHHDKKVISDISDPKSMNASLYANDRDAVVNTKWEKFCGYYKASGGEKFLSFGKFGKADSKSMKDMGYSPYFEVDGYQSKAFYQLDNIEVRALTEDTECGCADPIEIETDSTVVEEKNLPPYLFALDASGSMKKDGLFDSLRLNLVRFLRTLPEQTPVSFVTFASTSRKIFKGKMGPTTAHEVDSLLNRAAIGGGTNVFVGLQLAYDSWQPAEADSAKLVLISDGEFHVTPKIVDIIKREYDSNGRKLTLIQIGARASGLEQIEAYMDGYIHTTQTELSQAISQLTRPEALTGGVAVSCECTESFSDTMNYHFVIDFSGSMAEEKDRALMAFNYLFNQTPETAMISITKFNTDAQVVYYGRKADAKNLTFSLYGSGTGGGTDPTPGMDYALDFARQHSENRYSHIILITDLSAMVLSMKRKMTEAIRHSSEEFPLSASSIEVSAGGFVTTRSQFDVYSKRFVGVSRTKFENDLFKTSRSSCDYTSQPYHFNPAKSAMKSGTKKFFGGLLRVAANTAVNMGT